jgi:hypothetical protein
MLSARTKWAEENPPQDLWPWLRRQGTGQTPCTCDPMGLRRPPSWPAGTRPFGSSAVSPVRRPVALRRYLAVGLPLSGACFAPTICKQVQNSVKGWQCLNSPNGCPRKYPSSRLRWPRHSEHSAIVLAMCNTLDNRPSFPGSRGCREILGNMGIGSFASLKPRRLASPRISRPRVKSAAPRSWRGVLGSAPLRQEREGSASILPPRRHGGSDPSPWPFAPKPFSDRDGPPC